MDYEVRVVVMRFYFISSEKQKVRREGEVDVEQGRGLRWLGDIQPEVAGADVGD